MSQCNHTDGDICVKCGKTVNGCCLDDSTYCETCGNTFCNSCYTKEDKRNDEDCPCCSGDTITDAMILDYLLDKYKLSRKKIETKLKKRIKKSKNK